ncbi:hypothetical protein Tsubulata_012205 [Turnera subulata]|uniref:Uncharacterized protein n=1 Tax=Turnera subulata TaxID=218843 RepID=A0A9Q0J7D0_9ROSI|nr:hypothetical protein Tsubulata_012205 [Turnera subulata]
MWNGVCYKRSCKWDWRRHWKCACSSCQDHFRWFMRLGICHCIAKSICKMCCAACETYWHALEDITCCLWHKLRNTKRVNRRRRRFRDVEEGYSSTSESEFSDYHHHISVGSSRKRKSIWQRRKDRSGSSRHHRHHVRLKTREISVRVKGGSRRRRRSSRRLQLVKARNHRREFGIFKRQRLR